MNAAKQEKEQAINRAEREYNRVIPQARGKAEKELANANAYSVKVVNRAKVMPVDLRKSTRSIKKPHRLLRQNLP